MHMGGKPWIPAAHAAMRPAFKAAVRTLLLVVRRGGQRCAVVAASAGSGTRTRRALAHQQAAQAVALLGALPRDVLLTIVRLVSMPLMPWLADD